MKKFFIKMILGFLGHSIYSPEKIEVEQLNAWLVRNYKDRGWASYYSMRKKYLVNLLALGLEGKEQQETIGRLNELKALATNIKTAVKKYEDRKKGEDL